MERFKIVEGLSKCKPLCDALKTNPTIANAKELQKQVLQISPAVIQDLQSYLLVPLVIHLHNTDLSKEIKLHLVNCLHAVISKTRITKADVFSKLFSTLVHQIFDNNQKLMVIQSHEELKENVLSTLTSLICHGCTDVIEEFYVRDNIGKLGQAIYLCISIAKTERSQSLRLTAIKTIITLSLVHDDDSGTIDSGLQAQAADIIMLISPGIITGLQETAQGTEIQSHRIPMMALRALNRILTLIMADLPEPDIVTHLISLSGRDTRPSDPLGMTSRSKDEMMKFMETTKRTQEWLDAASIKFNVCIQALVGLVKHSNFKVRKELAEFSYSLLVKCPRNMKTSHKDLAEILITLSEDDNDEVCLAATKALNEISRKYAEGNNAIRPVLEELEESFYTLLTKLPRIMRTGDHFEQISCLNHLGGYIKILGKERLPQIMFSVAHLQRLLLALVYTTELDCGDISLLEDVAIKDFDNIIHHHGFDSWKHFKFLRDSAIEIKIKNICRLIGENGDLKILVDTILDMMLNMSQYRKELTLLLNWIIGVPVTHSSDFSEYQSVVEYYMMQSTWNLPLTVSVDTSLRQAQSNVVQCCLLLEGLEIIAQALGKQYQRFLLKTLYLVIERAGNRQTLVSIAGFRTLTSFAKAMQCVSTGNLLQANVDYLSYHITLKLRRVERNLGVLDVVSVVMKQCTMDILPALEEIVQDVLSQSNMNFQEQNCYSFLKVFHTFITCIRRVLNSKIDVRPKTEIVQDLAKSEAVIKILEEYCKAKEISKKLDDELLSESCEESSDLNKEDEDLQDYNNYEEEKKPPIPLYAKMTESILNRCIHFLPSKDVAIKLLAIETLQEGLIILSNWEDELLPIVHLLWHPLVHRFRDPSPIIINRAWGLLCTLAYVSKDFIRSRTLKEVLPSISDFLIKSAKESYRKDSGHVYKYTQVFKLQKNLLSQLGEAVDNLKFREREVWDVLEAARPYLSKYQHHDLQIHCVELYKKIADYNDDIVWVKCLSISRTPENITKMLPSYSADVEKVANFNIQNEYQVNIETILTYIQDKMLNM
ncbi:TELO2-interacting protein 1 homolog [Athalia rosae]|uniref:TELO2-interacting protein 1 homolog n=1 Tax=Athalia rosae TaxID=37344 RepID=UPI002033A63E|nr:TELO2-interacting protein 1 homolog [Athalia rosae]XP_012260553.2 TELO2-interacting protein 1 homolog [Athalia rosae]